MRKITQQAVNAFNNNTNFKSGNTTVTIEGGCTVLRLHGNMIACRDSEGVFIKDGGWQSNTTKERLNALTGVSICQKNWVWYLNGKEWNGDKIYID